MEKTQLLFYEDTHQVDFTARVLSVEPADKEYQIVLDKTCFYPEGGGQPPDAGTIDGIPVTEVRKKDGVVYHRMPRAPGKKEIHGCVDWKHRFDYMQQHSGQHILSAVLYRTMGYNTLSVHFGEDYSSIEIDTEDLGSTETAQLEDEANRLICNNIPIREDWTTAEGLKDFSLRRPSKVGGDIRIISLDDVDAVACGGIHCGSTGEVGLVKIIGTEKIRAHTRLLFKIGQRAYDDYRRKTDITAELCILFSAKPDQLPERAAVLLRENADLKQELAAVKREQALAEADRLYREAPADKEGRRHISGILRDYEARDIIVVMKHLIEREKVQACLVSRGGDEIFWCIGCSREEDFLFNDCRGELLAAVNGKGGGRHPMWQGMGKDPAGTEEFIRLWRSRISGAP